MRKMNIYLFLALGFVIIFFIGLLWYSQGVVILHYHAVNNDQASEELIRVTPEDFDWQMNHLKKWGYHVVSLQQAVKYLKDGKPLPRKAVAITFDDGYEDNFGEAFPLLRKYAYPATIFMVTGQVGGQNSWDKGRVPRKKMLNWDQIKWMETNGISFQAHTVHHLNLTKIPVKQVQYEISASQDALERHLTNHVNFLAYPYGSINPDVVQIAKKEFEAAFSSSPGAAVYGNTDLFKIRRMSVKEMHSGAWGHWLFVMELRLSWLIALIEDFKISLGNISYSIQSNFNNCLMPFSLDQTLFGRVQDKRW
ncbi:polysaccharide deacetylase family protein [Candidatus Formimonas warabiya]|uniref:NodB homology domain-containing protein n=1 Tax=Formimonas warabiya TaxID=1761012 RepID=A0A3G1KPD7_FORW1|nr:polysaccharide deacetylase family protein [Candidatus Formimonas warabiya]ATW24329.1 hypothetical protein DCMF_05585 [Candidatus Formimonas warabiya]